MAKGLKAIEAKIKQLEAKKKVLEQEELTKLGSIAKKYSEKNFEELEKMIAELKRALRM